jgi:PAS domain S-box-containing protein
VWATVDVALVREAGAPRYLVAQIQDISERKRVEAQHQIALEALQISEARGRAIVDSALDAIVTMDEAGFVTAWNPAAERIFGFTPERAIGRELAELIIPPAMRDLHRAGVKHRVEFGEGPVLNKRLEVPAIHEDGRELAIELIATRMPTPGKAQFTGFLRDITQLREAQKGVEEGHQRLKSLFDHNTDGIASLAPDGTFLDVNPALLSITGYTREDLVSHSLRDFLALDDQQRVWDEFHSVTTGENQRTQFGFNHRLGYQILLQAVSAPMIVNGAVVGVYMLLRDITESARVEERLRLLESVAVHANDAILITEAEPVDSPGPRILYANEAFCRMSGYNLEEVLGQTPRILQGPNTAREPRDKIRAALEKWQPVVVELINYHKDGTEFWVELSIVPVCNESGWYTHWVSLQRDITARKENEAALERAREDAESANRAKSEFLSRMSHELRTPLNAILGFGQLLEHGELDEPDQESVTHILKGGRHLLGLINEVLDIARIEAGSLSLSPEPVSLAQACGETLDMVRPIAAKRRTRVDESAARDSSIYVMADLGRFKQILINLLSNAVKYGREGGEVSLHIEARDGQARVGVRDNGPGIAPEQMERLWTPFDRLGAEDSGVEGTGIGLTLSRTLAEAMGGTLSVESEVGHGSTFWLALPLAHDPMDAWSAPEQTQDARPSAFVDERFLVLCIEDNTSNLHLIQKIIARRPEIRLITATDGASGLELAREHNPDLVLLDLHLPAMRGEEVLEHLRADAQTREIPVVVVSADATPHQIERALARGATAYLAKPFDVAQLLSTMDALLVAPAFVDGSPGADSARENSEVVAH